MKNNTAAYEFKVMVEEDQNAELPYRVYVNYIGDSEFYEKLIKVANRDQVLFTGRPAPFTMRWIFKTNYLYYLEQKTDKKINPKFLSWSLEDILRKKENLLLFKDRAVVIEFRKGLRTFLNEFAKHIEQGKI
ncbi:hypothetical protein M3649_03120 [Ureibacillus chungkukjangi]|uniref:hypothetical protein n=1 Tax=Ureibacillus chungkukjangi TaxID=1202712 RepID=UPI00204166F2|nr:hypothetical protein [Ureibacillus chungkukjangi]MCM3387122.1 hypothetical protein [Ureibacillus chungkukjangi]